MLENKKLKCKKWACNKSAQYKVTGYREDSDEKKIQTALTCKDHLAEVLNRSVNVIIIHEPIG